MLRDIVEMSFDLLSWLLESILCCKFVDRDPVQEDKGIRGMLLVAEARLCMESYLGCWGEELRQKKCKSTECLRTFKTHDCSRCCKPFY